MENVKDSTLPLGSTVFRVMNNELRYKFPISHIMTAMEETGWHRKFPLLYRKVVYQRALGNQYLFEAWQFDMFIRHAISDTYKYREDLDQLIVDVLNHAYIIKDRPWDGIVFICQDPYNYPIV